MSHHQYISIIIVNYNTHQYVIDCIESIIRNTYNLRYEIIIMDNSDEYIRFRSLLSQKNNIQYYKLELNKGFGYACNRGVEKANGNVLLFLNPDILITNGSIENLCSLLFEKEDAGFVTGILTDNYNNLQYFYNYFPGLLWEFKEAFGLYVAKTINKLNDVEGIKNKIPFQIDWAHGACLIIKSKVFKMTFGFDENIFLYYEDVDIQKQVISLHYRNYCQPNSQFIHFERGSIKSIDGLKIYHFYMHFSKLYYMKKYYPFWKRLLIRMFYLFGYSTKIIMLPFRVKYKNERIIMLSIYSMILFVYLNFKKRL